MGQTPRILDEDEWTIRSVTDGRSRKASKSGAGKAAVIFQHETDDAYVALTGSAALRVGAAEDPRRWLDAYEVYFPGEGDVANAAFIEICGERLSHGSAGSRPSRSPGMRPTRLERGATGAWLLTCG